MNSSLGKRITYKRTRPNPLFQEWLEELHEEAKEKNSKLEPMLREALNSLTKYPLPLASGSECAILKGFEKKLCIFLDKRLEVFKSLPDSNLELNANNHYMEDTTNEYCKTTKQCKDRALSQENVESFEDSEENTNPSSDTNFDQIVINKKQTMTSKLAAPIEVNSNSTSQSKNMRKSKKTYKPVLRSGGFAILIALLENSKEKSNEPGLNKVKLIEKAQKHSEESFTRSKPDSFYTAWSNMSRLITKGLVVKSNRDKKPVYTLTDQGFLLAQGLIKEAATMPTVNDIIFNDLPFVDTNRVRVVGNENPQINCVHLNITAGNIIEMLAGSFDIILIIDKNETSGVSKKDDPTVAQFNKYPNLKHEYRSLKVGDFTWVAQHKINKDQELVLPYIIERKRMDDLGASIKDGRFHEQKFRLRRCGLKNVIYMVENYGKNKHTGLPLQSLMQALANTRVQDGFKVHVTDSLTNSVRFLAMMTKRLTLEYKDKNVKGGDREYTNNELMTFDYFNKSSMKSKPLTVTETFIKMLLQLKGVSVEKALAITKEYNTPKSLIEAYKGCSVEDGRFLLANLKYSETGRNVGPIVSKSIYHLFTNSG